MMMAVVVSGVAMVVPGVIVGVKQTQGMTP
jgi:hypothetical protein